MKIAFMFSGQGAQYPGMMRDINEYSTEAAKVFACADCNLDRSISSLCFDGTQDELNLTHNTQPCVLAADLAAAAALRENGIAPDAVAGFSLGEYAALVYAGVFSMQEAFRMVQIRADAMQQAVAPGDGAMAALIGADASQIEILCAEVKDHYVVAANYNSPMQTVISGETAGVEAVLTAAATENIKGMKLAVSAPFHCKLMKPAAEKMREVFSGISFNVPKIPVYMNVDGINHQEGIKELLVKQAMSPVRWTDTLRNMQNNGIDTYIECGPGRTLSGLVKKTLTGVRIYRVENLKTLQSTLKALRECE